MRLPRIKRQRTGTGGTVPWVPHRFCDAWGVIGFSVYVAFNRLASSDATPLMTTDRLAFCVRESSASVDFFNPNSQSSLPGSNSSDPSACAYWSSVAAIVSATLSRGARRHSNSLDPAILSELDPNSSASIFLRSCVGRSRRSLSRNIQ